MRVVIAGARSGDVSHLLQTLSAGLPSHLTCIAWHAELSLSADDIVLLLGLDQATPPLSQTDTTIRSALTQFNAAYRVLYGDAATQLQEARHAIAQALLQHDPVAQSMDLRPELKPRWQGWCDACSDPQCEHRLFRQWVQDKPSLQ